MRKQIQPWGLLTVAGSLICAATLFGFAGRFWWIFDLFSHFRVQYLFSISLIFVLLLLGKRYGASAVFAVCAVVNLACISPYYSTSRVSADYAQTVVRAISFNVYSGNENFDLVKRFIIANNPDVVLLMEVNDRWVEALEELQPLYPYYKFEPCRDNFGIALYSKLPPIACEFVYLGRANLPSTVAEFNVAGKKLTLLGTHLLPPLNSADAQLRNDQVEAIATYLGAVEGPKILMGDLNMTPWSHDFGRLLDAIGLVDSSKGRGIQPTWPTNQILLRIPIDFCLISEGIIVKDKTLGPDLGSDHFPLIVDFTVIE